MIFVNNPDVTSGGTLYYNVSDHVPVYVIHKKIKIKPTKTEFFGRTYRNYSKDILAQKMQDIDGNDLLLLDNLDVIWESLYERIIKIVNDICPFKKSKYTNSRAPWITHELMELAKDRDYFMTLAKRKPTEEIVQRANALRNEAKSAFNSIDPNLAKSAHVVCPQSGHIRPEKWTFFKKIPHFSKLEPHTKLRTAHRGPIYQIKANENLYRMQKKSCNLEKYVCLSRPLNLDILLAFEEILENHGEIPHSG